MLLPFVLIQFPLGWFADKLWGEKELLVIGFIIIAGSTLLIPYVPNKLFFLGGILFLTRVGASMIEVMSETYFFKKVNEKEPKVLSLYRLMTPVAFILGPISGGLIIHYFGFEPLFAILASLLLIGIILSLRLHDTK
jgi:MFS family permease